MRKPWYRATIDHYGPGRQLEWTRHVLVLAPEPAPLYEHRRRPIVIPLERRRKVS